MREGNILGAFNMLMRLLPAFIVTALLIYSDSTSAQSYLHKAVIANCQNVELDADHRIDACTQLIHSNMLRGHFIAHFYFHRGAAYDKKDDITHAIEDYSEAIRLNPEHAMAYNNRCFALTKSGRAQDAIADCDKSLALRPNNGPTLDSRGYAHLKLGQYALAIQDYDVALNVMANSSYSLFGRGVAKLRSADTVGGNADIEAAKKIDPDIVAKMEKLGITP